MKRLIIVLIIVIISLGLGVTLYSRMQVPKTNEPSHEEIISAITYNFPMFLHDNAPVIEVTDVERIDDKWYVVTIKSIHEKEAAVPVKIIMINENNSGDNLTLRIVTGPDTYFTEPELLRYNVPDSVILELEES